MSNYASEEYSSCKEWVAAKIQEGFTWEDVKNLCVSPDQVEAEFDNLRYVTLEISLKKKNSLISVTLLMLFTFLSIMQTGC